ncbi:MAG: DUF4112 domain-containing protein [Bradyrhizobiaceae bacterium]|nr:MAG: DUF4112 domain-containing protein [Bradyrhizobiaceae bacterium]
MSDTFFTRERASNRRPDSAKRRAPPIIDQDGNEIPGSDPFGGGFFGSGFNKTGGFNSAGGFNKAGGSTASGFGLAGLDKIVFGRNLTHEQRLARLDALAQLLDVAFVVPGTKVRYGIDGIIGLVPVVGDLITTAFSLWIVREARALGAPRHLVARMLGNVALDGVVGIVPFAGDAFDVMFRANMRNIRMFRRWREKQARRR